MNVDNVNVGQKEGYLGFDALDDDGGLGKSEMRFHKDLEGDVNGRILRVVDSQMADVQDLGKLPLDNRLDVAFDLVVRSFPLVSARDQTRE